jgi:hypothetical protein
MGASAIGTVFGFALGAATGTAMGAFAGAFLGMFVGLGLGGLFWMRAHLGDTPTVERHLVMCTPFGHAADCQFEGDLETGRWYDVKSCSLLRPASQVDCDKGCLRQLQLSGVRPGRS